MRKRIIATLMALCMALSLLPVQVLATEGAAQKTESAEQTTGAASGGAEGAYANGADAKIALLQGTEQAYQLFVKMPTGSTITLNGVSSGDTIFSVKTRIARETSIPAEQMLLTFKDNGLADEKTLAECGIQRESTLILRLKITEAAALAEAVQKSGTVTLGADIDIDSTLVISSYVSVTLDLNGYMLRMTGSASVLTVESGGHLTIADSRPDAEERRFAPDGDGLWVLDATGEKSVTGGIITGGTGTLGRWYFYGGGVYVNSGGHLTMEGGSIVGCSAYGANGIYGDGGGVFLKSNYGESIDRTTFTMNGGSIIGCTAGSLGGGVVVARSTFTMNKGSILSCTAKESGGGGVDVQNGGSFTMKDGVISDCVSRGGETWKFGGGVYVENGSFTMDGGRITACRADNTSDPKYGRGGGVALSGQGVFELNAGTIDASCTATGAGGAVYSTGGTLCANGGTIAGGVMNSYGTITGSGGTRFSGSVTNDEGGSIKSGTFEETSDVLNYGTIDPGVKLPGEITVTYMADGAMYAQHFLKKGAMTRQPNDPAKNGYAFDGWCTSDGEAYDFSTEVTDNLTLTAKWRVARFRDVYTEEALREALTQKTVGIRLADNIKLTQGPLKITYEVTLDLNGKVLEQSGADSVFVIGSEKTKERGKLTVVDSDTTREHKFKPNADHLWGLDETGGTETVNGGIITGGRASSGGGVNVENGTLIMEGGSIVGCRALNGQTGSGSGGGVHVSDQSSFEMYDGAGIYGCTAGTIQIGGGSGSGGGVVTDGGEDANGTFFMYGGTIESCTAGGKGGGVSNDGVFVMKGGSIRSCSVVSTGSEEGRGGSIHFSGSTTISGKAEISAPNNGKLHIVGRKTLTISGDAEIKASMDLEGDLYADGGTISGEVATTGAITGSEGATGTTTFTKAVESSGTIENGVFEGEVTNKESGTIKGGTFKKKVANEGTIEGGTFEGTVRSRTSYGAEKAAVIRDGTFNGHVESYSSIENGVFAGEVESEGTISGGTFTGTVMNKVGSTIEGGTFTGAVDSYGTIENGVFKGEVTNGGTITGGTFRGEVTCEGRGSNVDKGSLVGGTVSGGSFDQTIQVIFGTIIGEEYTRKWDGRKPSAAFLGEKHTLTYQADGKDYAWQVLHKDFFPVMPQGPGKEGHTFLTWVYADGEDKGKMIDEGAPIGGNRTAVARYAVGSGTEQDPCRIGSEEELALFRVQVNRFGRTDLCAVLTSDIVINSGTFDADGRYTPAAGETVSRMNPIGSETQPYTGTFDGGGYTIRGLCVSKRSYYNGESYSESNHAGLFGKLSGATVKNLTVTGYVDGRFYVGGIAGYADDTTKLLNCRNECIVVSGQSTYPYVSDPESVIRYAGGIVGYNAGSVTACCNTGTVTGIDSVGGITGGGPGTVSDCYNVGTVTASGQNAGGIAGNGGTVSYSYNVGTVTGGAEIANNAAVNDCCFLGAAGQTAGAFADGTVLTALIGGRAGGAHPWDTECVSKRLSDGGMRLPVLVWQKLSAAHEGGTATCSEKAVCTLCGQAYGDKDAANHDLKHAAAKGSGFYAEGNIEYWQCRDCGKYFADAKAAKEITRADTVIPAMGRPDRGEPVKAPGTGDAGIALYGVTALLSLTGCAWLRRKKK